MGSLKEKAEELAFQNVMKWPAYTTLEPAGDVVTKRLRIECGPFAAVASSNGYSSQGR
jgi:hypothetical protein